MFTRASQPPISSSNPSSVFPRLFWLPKFFLLTVSLLWIGKTNAQNAAAHQAQANEQSPQPLEAGKPIERELTGGQSHVYLITLAEGQYFNVVVVQRGIDAIVHLGGPKGQLIFEFDTANGQQGQEQVSQVAEAAGGYRLNIQTKQPAAAIGRYEIRLVEIRAATEQDRALQEARDLNVDVLRLYGAGRYDEALPMAEQVLAIREKMLGVEHLDVASSLNNLANLYADKGDYVKAEILYQRALAIREKVLGPEHPSVAGALDNLALIYADKGSYEKAEPLHQRALAILEKVLGPEHPNVATSCNNLALLYQVKGDFAQAEPLYQRALVIWEKALGPEHPRVAASLHNLGNLLYIKGDYVRAEPLHQRALAIREKALGPEHPDVAGSLSSLAILYSEKGDHVKAEPLYQRALAIWEKALGPEHPSVARVLNRLANHYNEKGDYAKAEPLYQRALAIREKALGQEHPSVASSLNDLAVLYQARGDYVRAEPLYQRALRIWEKALGPENSRAATSLASLALLYQAKGDYAKAEPLFQRALAIWEKAFGPEHPDVAKLLNNLANLYSARDNFSKAVSFRLRASTVSERNLGLNIMTGSERQKLAYLATLAGESDQIVSLHVRSMPSDSTALSLALTTILQRKGRALDAMTNILAVLRRRADPQNQPLFDQLQETTSKLARLGLNGPERITTAEYQQQIRALEEKKEKLESDISVRSSEFRTQLHQVTLAAVQAEIPDKATLIEFFAYHPFDTKHPKEKEAFGTSRYVAYVLQQRGEVQWVDLGETTVIDAAVENLRQALRNPKRTDVKRQARKVDQMVMQPLRPLLGTSRRILLSPDSVLNLVPFAALVDEQKQFLIQHYTFTYLTSGRDLLRLQTKQESKSVAVVLADPAFDGQPMTDGLAQRDIKPVHDGSQFVPQIIDFASAKFELLPGAAGEARALKQLLPDARVLTREEATEAALKQTSRPRLLHIATHGFFLPYLKLNGSDSRNGETVASTPLENPLLRSGLALAGANQRKSGDNDGIVTALEVAGLDLWGTKLVVLSACNTGVGDVRNGDGVYGLRRALVLAGSESQVMSLWKVSDQGTKELMVEYYKRLLRGEGRGEGLRQVQLRMLKNPKRSHPFYWASFIQSGEWANLDGKR